MNRSFKWKLLSCVRLFVTPWNSLGQNTGMSSLSLLQGIFPTQGMNPGLPHWRQIFHQLSHKGSPRILEWVAYPFSSGSSPLSKWGLLHCRLILYQLSYQGSLNRSFRGLKNELMIIFTYNVPLQYFNKNILNCLIIIII